jgi:thiol-disulfide isomerase/thioredoxin
MFPKAMLPKTMARHIPGRRAPSWLFACAAAVFVALVAGCPAPSGLEGTRHPAVGQKLGQLELQSLTGESQDTTLPDLSGQVVLINFWGTWCPPCIQEFPHIDELEEKYAGREDFRLFAVSSAPGSSAIDDLRSETEEFLKANGSDLPTYADVEDRTRASVEETVGWQGYPTTVVLDRGGTIRGVWVGYEPGTEQAMDALVGELLETQPREEYGDENA